MLGLASTSFPIYDSSQKVVSSPAEVLEAYIISLLGDNMSIASELRFNPLSDWVNFMDVIGTLFVISFLLVAVKLTGLNPFSTMLNCWLIKNFVSEENRRYIPVIIVGVVLAGTIALYFTLSNLLMTINMRIDKAVLDGVKEVRVLSSNVSDDKAFVEYELRFADGQKVKRRAELKLQKGSWRVNRL